MLFSHIFSTLHTPFSSLLSPLYALRSTLRSRVAPFTHTGNRTLDSRIAAHAPYLVPHCLLFLAHSTSLLACSFALHLSYASVILLALAYVFSEFACRSCCTALVLLSSLIAFTPFPVFLFTSPHCIRTHAHTIFLFFLFCSHFSFLIFHFAL